MAALAPPVRGEASSGAAVELAVAAAEAAVELADGAAEVAARLDVAVVEPAEAAAGAA